MKFDHVIKLHLNNKMVKFCWKQISSYVTNDHKTWVGYPMFAPSCALDYTVPSLFYCHWGSFLVKDNFQTSSSYITVLFQGLFPFDIS